MLEALMPFRTGRVSRRRRQSSKSKSLVRPDIQGLRAFAVVVVIMDHLVGWPSGGFIGVDVFFVISGFLITGLLLREYERSGSVSFKKFYKRRAKRILPASLLVLTVTILASYLIFGWSRFVSILWDGIAAGLFAANWRFAIVGNDYFQADGPVSPLQHYWSLAVEEQFYFVWPLVMLLVAFLVAKSGKGSSARLGIGIAISAISVVSFLWALWESQNNNNIAYFSTISRAWELGVGAILAVIAPTVSRIHPQVRPVLAWVGIAGILSSLFLVDNGLAFPAPLAALPVLSVALIIVAGTGTSEHRYIWPLTNRASGYVGNISFSLYLWHFPIIILAGQFVDATTTFGQVQIATLFILVSIYSYHLVEDPVRKSGWLDDTKRRRKKPAAHLDGNYKLIALSALACLTVLVTVPMMAPKAAPAVPAVAPLAEPEATLGDDAVTDVSERARLQTEIRASITATSWPELSPTMEEAIAGSQAPDDITACGLVDNPVDETACTWGAPEAPNTAIVIGDSTSLGYVAGIRSIIDSDPSWRVMSYGTFGCSYTEPVAQETVEAECAGRKSDAIDAINRIKPDVVFMTSSYNERKPAGVGRPLTQSEKVTGVELFVSKFQESAGQIVFIAPAPEGKNIAKCYTKLSSPGSCMSKITSRWLEASALEGALAEKLGASYIDSRDWFCVQGQCPVFVETIPVKLDLAHVTPEYQMRIAPVIVETLRSNEIL